MPLQRKMPAKAFPYRNISHSDHSIFVGMNEFVKHYTLSALLPLALLACIGCNSGLRTEYVDGIVTLDGTPVEGALVTFIPVSPGEARVAAGTTDVKGRYTLTVAEGGRAGRGTTVGEYKVTVAKRTPDKTKEKTEAAAGNETGASEQPPSREEMAAAERARRSAGLPPPFLYLTPKKYNNPETSGLTASVVKGSNKFDFALTEK